MPVASFTITKLAWLREHEPERVRPGRARAAPPRLADAAAHRRAGHRSRRRVGDRATGRRSSDGYVAEAFGLLGARSRRRTHGARHRTRPPARTATRSVAAGTGDNMGAALGLGLQEGDVAISLGTSGTVFAVSPRPTSDASGAVAGFADATGRFLPLACTLNATKVTDTMARLLGTRAPRARAAGARVPAGCAAAWCSSPTSTANARRTCPTPPACCSGLRSDTEPAQLARAAYEGVVCGLLDALDALRDAGVPTDERPPRRRGRRCAFRRVPAADRRPPPAAGRGAACRPSTSHAARACRPPPSLTGRDVATVAREWAPSDGRVLEPDRVGRRRRRSRGLPHGPPALLSRVGSSLVIRTSFNDDWRVRPKVSHFLELFGGGATPWEAVTLPHDAMIGGTRDPDGHCGHRLLPRRGLGVPEDVRRRARARPRQARPGRVRGRVPRRVGAG